KGKPQDCPFRYQGQYEDTETGLYYNRFRYFDPEAGQYVSQDPIRLRGGILNFYAYVHDPNGWIDVLGLAATNPGDAGAFGDLKGVPGDGLTPHHMPQDASGHLPRNEGGALVMPHDEHVQTRTYGARGRATKIADTGRPFRDVLVDDIRDVRNIVGDKYDSGIEKLIEYYENKGMLPQGSLKLKDICP
ncbi:RHS repeat-associated core domain-containing protein, partial [Hymenobacter sediminis]|uniref:RHS repeat-associated core domain-containing protein n=1 Tax=Hymenobacter sediminis TaxID=2218621 RepID=UPI0010581102